MGNCTFKKIWQLISGRDLSPSEYNEEGNGMPYITGASNFCHGNVSIVRWTLVPQVITETGDLLITCKGTVGEMSINTFGMAHIARQIMEIRNVYSLNIEYLALCIQFYIGSIKRAAKGLIPGISREEILNLILPVPCIHYQRKVVNMFNQLNRVLMQWKRASIEALFYWN